MLKRVASYLLLIPAAYLGTSYADSGVVLPLLLLSFCALAMVAITSPRLGRRKVVALARMTGTIVSAALLLAWVTSVVAYVQAPYAKVRAIALGGGNIWFLSDASVSGAALGFVARWSWHGWTGWSLGQSWLTYGSFGHAWPKWTAAATAEACYYAIGPALVGIGVPTTILWLLLPREVPAGCCQRCGYNLTGNISGRCPECGSAVGESSLNRA